MRAEASTDSARARSWQSQRVTRRSLMLPAPFEALRTVFHPVPSQNGQIPAGALITFTSSSSEYGLGGRLAPFRFVQGLRGSTKCVRAYTILSTSTLHQRTQLAQGGIPDFLCTSCERTQGPVEGGGKRCCLRWKAAPLGPIQA